MPIFEYACQGCRSEFELLIRGGEQPVCPSCQSVQLDKKFSVPAAHTGGSRELPGELPICAPPQSGGGCGLPQCGMGGCQGMGM